MRAAFFLAQRDGVNSSSMIAPSRPGSSNVNSCGCECEVIPEKGYPQAGRRCLFCVEDT